MRYTVCNEGACEPIDDEVFVSLSEGDASYDPTPNECDADGTFITIENFTPPTTVHIEVWTVKQDETECRRELDVTVS